MSKDTGRDGGGPSVTRSHPEDLLYNLTPLTDTALLGHEQDLSDTRLSSTNSNTDLELPMFYLEEEEDDVKEEQDDDHECPKKECENHLTDDVSCFDDDSSSYPSTISTPVDIPSNQSRMRWRHLSEAASSGYLSMSPVLENVILSSSSSSWLPPCRTPHYRGMGVGGRVLAGRVSTSPGVLPSGAPRTRRVSESCIPCPESDSTTPPAGVPHRDRSQSAPSHSSLQTLRLQREMARELRSISDQFVEEYGRRSQSGACRPPDPPDHSLSLPCLNFFTTLLNRGSPSNHGNQHGLQDFCQNTNISVTMTTLLQ